MGNLVLFIHFCWGMSEAKTLNVRLRTEPGTLQWLTQSDMDSWRLVNLLLMPLIQWDSQKLFIRGVASHWTKSKNGLQYDFYLDPLAQWSDGTMVQAEDFVRAVQWFMDPENGSPVLSAYLGILDKDSLQALSRSHLQIRLKRRCEYLLSLLTFLYPLHQRENVKVDSYPRFTNDPFEVHRWKDGTIKLRRKQKRISSIAHSIYCCG
jgi:ABC-type oligopeptide transport system, periplasmic component